MTLSKFAAIIAAIVAVLLFTEISYAQCASSTCNQSTHHWDFTGIDNSGSATNVLGMSYYAWCDCYWPTLCVNGTLQGVLSWLSYPTRQLTADASVCLGSAHDSLSIVSYGSTYNCAGTTIRGFSHGAYELTISGGSGNDSLHVASAGGDTNVCGGSGNDTIMGSSYDDYLHAGSDNDLVDGGGGDDHTRGHDGRDIMSRGGSSGLDYIRGEADTDCFELDEPSSGLVSGSGCGSGTDYYSDYSADSCENDVSLCATVAGPSY